MVPSGEKATEYTLPVCPVSVAILDRAATSHNFTVASDDAEARVVPSGEKATDHTLVYGAELVCPVSVAILDRAATSHNSP